MAAAPRMEPIPPRSHVNAVLLLSEEMLAPAEMRQLEIAVGINFFRHALKLRNAAQKNETLLDNFGAYNMRVHLFKQSLLLGWKQREPSDDDVIDHLTRFWSVRILQAETGTAFLTSDNPSVWIASKGANPTLEMVILPLTPDYVAVAFDKRRKEVVG